MSAWRQKAIGLFPDLREEFEDPKLTIYQVFFELLPRVREAHSRNDNDELRRIYAYAEWCYDQKAKDLWNAAGVAFYEHLVDGPVTFAAIPHWLSPKVFAGVRTLFEARLAPAEYRRLYDAYCEKHGSMEQPRLIAVEGPNDWTV